VKAQRILEDIQIDMSQHGVILTVHDNLTQPVELASFYVFQIHTTILLKQIWGEGTNNQGEFKALFFLVKVALDRGIFNLQIFVDSLLVISSMKDSVQVHNNALQSKALQIKEITRHYQQISFSHIYGEHDTKAYLLSKEGKTYLKISFTCRRFQMVTLWLLALVLFLNYDLVKSLLYCNMSITMNYSILVMDLSSQF